MKALISEEGVMVLDERLKRAIGQLDPDEENVLRMRYGIGLESSAPLSIKPGLLRNPGAAAAVTEMERFLLQRGSELRGATPNDAAETFYGHGAHLGDDAEGEAIRLATSGVLH
jgi:hypothetical protein